MIIFLYGPDGYRLKQNSQVVLDNYRKKHPGGIFFNFDLSVADEMGKAEDAVKSGSLFGEVKLVVLKNVFADKTNSERIQELIKTQNLLKAKDAVLLFIENKDEKELAKNKILFNLLSGKNPAQSNSADRYQKGRTLGGASNVVRNFEYLEGDNLKKWVKSEFALRKCTIELEALKELIMISGNASWVLVNEIDKLCNFRLGGVIKKEDVSLLVSRKTDLNIFDLVDSIAEKNKAGAYEILLKEIQNSREPYYLLTMIIYCFRNLLTVKDLSDRGMSLDFITKKARLHPFVARKTYQSAEKFSLSELKKVYMKLLEIDTLSKKGEANLIDALFEFIVS